MSQQVFWNNKFSKVDYFYGTKANEFLRTWMESKNDWVTCFDGNHRFKDCC